MERVVFVYTAYPSLVEAEAAGRGLVEQRLAACVNILPGMISHYWWDGKVERGDEVVMIIKTRASLAEPVRAFVKAQHSYDTPSIVVLPVESVDQTYLAWMLRETAGWLGALSYRVDECAQRCAHVLGQCSERVGSLRPFAIAKYYLRDWAYGFEKCQK